VATLNPLQLRSSVQGESPMVRNARSVTLRARRSFSGTDTGQHLRSEMLIDLRSRRDRLILAALLFATGVTGTVADHNGPAGIVMFGVAATNECAVHALADS
jgi:hypothetical protein